MESSSSIRERPRPSPTAFGCAAASVLVLCACRNDASDTGHRFTVTAEDGVTVARTTGGPKYEAELFRYELVYQARQDPDVPDSMLWQPAGMALDHEMNLYVVDWRNHRVAVYDSTGTFSHTIGREGQGPGELQQPFDLSVEGDRVYITSGGRDGRHVFARSGEFMRFEPWPRLERIGSMAPDYWWLDDGTVVVRLVRDDTSGTRMQERAEIVVVGADGAESARVFSDWVHMYDLEGRLPMPMYYSAQPWGGFVPGRGIWTSTGAEPVIRWYDLGGREIARWVLDLPIAPITAEDRRAVTAMLDEHVAQAEGSGNERMAQRQRQWRNDMRFAEHKAFWGTGDIDDRGFLWLNPGSGLAPRPSPEDASYVILSPEGEYLGITRPGRYGSRSRGHLLATTDSADGERAPAVFRIVPIAEGLDYSAADSSGE